MKKTMHELRNESELIQRLVLSHLKPIVEFRKALVEAQGGGEQGILLVNADDALGGAVASQMIHVRPEQLEAVRAQGATPYILVLGVREAMLALVNRYSPNLSGAFRELRFAVLVIDAGTMACLDADGIEAAMGALTAVHSTPEVAS